jgi:hypothetical protein
LIILVGTFDMANPAWQAPCGPEAGITDPYVRPKASTEATTNSLAPIETCQNVSAIYALAHAQGIKVLLCSVPLTTDAGAAGEAIINQNPLDTEHAEEDFDFRMEEGIFIEGGLVDGDVYIMQAIETGLDGTAETNIVDWTDDGLNPNATGALAFTSAAQETISALAQVLAQEQAEGAHFSVKQRNQAIQTIIKQGTHIVN